MEAQTTTAPPIMLYDFEQALTSGQLRVSQIIQFALMAGAASYAGVVALLYVLTDAGSVSGADVLDTLSIVHAVFALTAIIVSNAFYRRRMSRDSLLASLAQPYIDENGRVVEATLGHKLLMKIRTVSLIRMAMLEGAAFFGLTVCMIAVTQGTAQEEPIYLLNGISTLVLVMVGIMTFPTKEKLVDIFHESIEGAY